MTLAYEPSETPIVQQSAPPTQQQTPTPEPVAPGPSAAAEPWIALVPMVILGSISAIAYLLGFVRPYLMADFYRQPLMDLAKINGHTAHAANDWALTWIVVFAAYYMAFRLCPSTGETTRLFRRVGLALMVLWAVFFTVSLLFMYPVGAADLFDQIFRARLLSHYGLNPFVTNPNVIAGDPFLPYVAWSGDPSPYGPVWETLAGATSSIAMRLGDTLWLNLMLFKGLVLAAYAVNVALTYGIMRVVRPDWALRGTLFFAWNPLLVFEVAGNGHNDSVVMMFVLGAVYLFVLARRSAVIPALMLGALTKFVPALLIPVAAAAIWRDRVGRTRTVEMSANGLPVRRRSLSNFDALSTLAIGGVAALGLAVVLYAPFWRGTESVGALGRKSLFTASIPKVALDILHFDRGMDEQVAQTLVRNGALALTLLVTLGLTVWVFMKGKARTGPERAALVDRTLRAFYEVIFFYLAFATLWFQPWYIVWLIALTAPVARDSYANRTILFCIGGVANYFVWDFIWLWNNAPIRENQVMSAVAIYTLPLAYSLYLLLRYIIRVPGVRSIGTLERSNV